MSDDPNRAVVLTAACAGPAQSIPFLKTKTNVEENAIFA